jgi:hypothetical protein
MMNFRRIRWALHVSSMNAKRDAYKILIVKLRGRHHLGNIDVDGRIILKAA